MKHIAIIYATREPHTRSIAKHIAELIRAGGRVVQLTDAGDAFASNINLTGANGAVLVSSLATDRLEPELFELVAPRRDHLDGLASAVVVVALVHDRDTLSGSDDVVASMEHFFEETGWHPSCDCSVAGMLAYEEHAMLLRWVMKCAGNGDPAHPPVLHTDWDGLDHFAAEFLTRVDAS